ncbi:hypothetical protein KI387_021532, partial [Taxus chinensis]
VGLSSRKVLADYFCRREPFYLVKGKVRAYVKGISEFFELGIGYLAVIANGHFYACKVKKLYFPNMYCKDAMKYVLLTERGADFHVYVQVGLSSMKVLADIFYRREPFYLVKGKVRAYVKGISEYFELGIGYLVVIANGMSCTWDVHACINTFYNFG